MFRKYRYFDPGMIVGAVVALIVLAVGIFTFFITINSITTTTNAVNKSEVEKSISNITDTSGSVFNIIGIVLIIGVVMAIVGVLYNFAGGAIGSSSSPSKTIADDEEEIKEKVQTYKPARTTPFKSPPPIELGDYKLSGMESVDDALAKSKQYRETGFWTKIINYENNKKINTNSDKTCGVYVSKWTRNEQETYGKPKRGKNNT